MDQVKDMFGEGELIGPNGPFPKSGAGPTDSTRRLSFKGMAGTLARSIRPDGQKALSPSGAAVVAQETVPDPLVAQERLEADIIDKPVPGNSFRKMGNYCE